MSYAAYTWQTPCFLMSNIKIVLSLYIFWAVIWFYFNFLFYKTTLETKTLDGSRLPNIYFTYTYTLELSSRQEGHRQSRKFDVIFCFLMIYENKFLLVSNFPHLNSCQTSTKKDEHKYWNSRHCSWARRIQFHKKGSSSRDLVFSAIPLQFWLVRIDTVWKIWRRSIETANHWSGK